MIRIVEGSETRALRASRELLQLVQALAQFDGTVSTERYRSKAARNLLGALLGQGSLVVVKTKPQKRKSR